jgi:two-component system, cell cycle sensor histidine kinase and response regulator CckA
MTILIVDDQPTNLKLLRVQLEGENHEVLQAHDGVEALELLDHQPVDVVISDILMPRMDGYRLCHEMRKSERLRGVPILIYTATYTSPSDEKLALDVGADKYMKKPSSVESLVASLREVIAMPRSAPCAEPMKEVEVLSEYSERLVAKLEDKNIALEQANTELRLARNQLADLLEHSPAVIYSFKVEGERVLPHFISENIRHLLGFTVEESKSFDWWVAQLHPEDRARAEGSVRESIAQGKCRVEYRLRRKDGSWIWIEDHRRLIRNSSGQPSDLVGVWTDLTERKRAERALQASNRRFREMLENVEMVSITLDTMARVTFCNNYFLRLTGWTREEVLGGDWFKLFIPEADTELRKRFVDTIEAGKTPAHYQNSIKTKAGELRMIAWNSTILRNGVGKILGIASLGEDITERQKHERMALRSQRLEAIGTLAGGVAHDLNNALAPIMMGVETLKMQYPDEAEILDMIQTSVRRGAEMVRQLLTFAKGAEGERVSIQPGHLLREMQSMMKGSLPKNIRLVVKSDSKIATVRGDATQLHQVLLNLCVNARDAMPHGGTLTLEARCREVDAAHAASIPDARPGHYVILRVSDTGTGIPAEIIDRIFEPFFTTKGPDKGTGLGLSTVLGIAKGHGGFLHVHSQPGLGSTFDVYLPAEIQGSAAELAIKPEGEFRGRSETVLLVDDEVAVREMARHVLRRLNFKPLTATDGADALMKVSEHRAELRAIITDLHMPHMDGLEFVRALRRMLPDIPVIVASGRMDEPLSAEFRSLGVTGRLDKPFTELQLAEALKNLLMRE